MKKSATVFLLAILLLPLNAFSNVVEFDRVVAVVNNDIITLSELNREINTIKKQFASKQNSLPPDDILQKQLLERLIVKRLQLEMAEIAGIRVTDNMLDAAVGDVANQNKLSIDELRQVLKRDGLDYESFRKNLRDQIIVQQLIARQVVNRIDVSEQEVDNFLENQKNSSSKNTSFHIGHILIATPESASPEKLQQAKEKAMSVLDKLREGADFKQTAISYSDGQQALSGGDLGWRKSGEIPSLFEDIVTQLSPGEVSKIIRSPSGYHIIKLFEAKGTASHIVKQTHVRHILIKTNELVSDDSAKSRLLQLKQRVEGGDSFAALAKSHSDDAGSTVKGGDLGWVSPGDLVPEFEKTMNSIGPGKVSAPFKSPFGWHILQVLERREHDSTQDYERSQARQAIRNRKIDEETQTWVQRLRDEAYVDYRLEE